MSGAVRDARHRHTTPGTSQWCRSIRQIFNRTQGRYLPCVAVQGDVETGYIIQQDAEQLGLNPAETIHVLRWTVVDNDGVPGTMRSSAFQVVPNKMINQNVVLGTDWQTKEALASSGHGPDTLPSRPYSGTLRWYQSVMRDRSHPRSQWRLVNTQTTQTPLFLFIVICCTKGMANSPRHSPEGSMMRTRIYFASR